EDILSEESVGLTEIPLDMIAGTRTAGRQKAFAANFMPLLKYDSEFGNKWSNLYDAQLSEGIRDPIKVYEYMKRFYVQEGNKRVSVLRFVGAHDVMADVTRLLPKKTEDPQIKLYYEFTEFYKVAPIYDISFSRPGSYRRLAEALGQTLEHPWSTEMIESVRDAYFYFCESYLPRGKALSITPGDAFLTYLEVYPLSSLSEGRGEIKDRIDSLWNEFLTESSGSRVELVKEPEDVANTDTAKTLLHLAPAYSAKKPLRAAFIYEKEPQRSAWAYSHDLGRRHLSTSFEGIVETEAFENCSSMDLVSLAIDAAVKNGADVIFTTSTSMMSATLKKAIQYPKVTFLNCSINLAYNAVRTYYGRLYGVKFVLGALAASLSKDHRIGYVADYPVYGMIANINAFAIGASMVDPEAKIYLKWSTMKGTDWKKELLDEGIMVYSGPDQMQPDKQDPDHRNRMYGIYRLERLEDGEAVSGATESGVESGGKTEGAQSEKVAGKTKDVQPEKAATGEAAALERTGKFVELADGSLARIENLAMPVLDWEKYYTIIIRSILDGTYRANRLSKKNTAMNYWLGLSAGVVDLILSEKLPYASKKMVRALKNAVADGSFEPFSGEIHSQSGVVHTADDHQLTDSEIIRMDWLNENIIGEIPENDALLPEMQETLQLTGVKNAES
ncbi:MAG: BMP family ABC transporter substrate-binding protein, partial [Lachnospiraceae bacterium]|nr:BMP family ABC transporter substrate-binding protein [Lachnospiraceae bacterium]